MTSIDPSHALASLLRTQVGSPRRRGAAQRLPAAAAPREQPASDVASLAAGRIRALAADDPQRKDKALRIFLETVLLQEFGAQLAGDAAFPDMLRAVQEQMRADSAVSAAADALAELLVAAAAGK